MDERVTWLLPVKNAMPYLTEALASIQAQTYRHWQVLAWDNGSTDGSIQELHRWIPSRLPGCVVADRPMGLGTCLAQMVQQASTALCARIDADDVNLPQRLERQVAVMRQQPDVGVVGTNIQFMDAAGLDRPGAWSVCTHDAEIRWRLRFCNALNHPTVLFRRSVIQAAGNYRDVVPGQDYDLWVRVATLGAMANLPGRLVRYRLLPSSVGATYRGPKPQLLEEIAHLNTPALFPGIPAQRAARLRRVVTDVADPGVVLRDCLDLRRCATVAARGAGRSRRYFRDTVTYQRQSRDLLLRWLKRRPAVAATWPVLRGVWRRCHRIDPSLGSAAP